MWAINPPNTNTNTNTIAIRPHRGLLRARACYVTFRTLVAAGSSTEPSLA